MTPRYITAQHIYHKEGLPMQLNDLGFVQSTAEKCRYLPGNRPISHQTGRRKIINSKVSNGMGYVSSREGN